MMTLLLIIAVWLSGSLVVVTYTQTLYLESLRLRSRDLPAFTFFKDTLEPRIGLKAERGVLAFSIIKHTTMVLLGCVFLVVSILRANALWEALLGAAVASWLVMFVGAYALPQVLYRRAEGHWLLPLAPMLRVFAASVRPLAAMLEFFQSVVEIGEPGADDEEGSNHVEHLDALISAGTEEGLFEEEDRKLIQAAVAFGDKTVREVMTPRPSIVAIEADQTLDDLRELVINEQYSRIPVYEDSIDRIIGFIHVRDMFELDDEERSKRKVRELMRPIRFVPETKPVSDLMREMQEDRAHMAVVVDEYGNTAGLATMEDLVEEILGDIRDEHEPDMDVKRESDGACVVSGSFDLGRLQDLFDFRPPEGTESTTIGGLAAEWLGRVPAAGETVERDGLRIEVLAGNERRVEQVRVRRLENTDDE
ncbi:MAG: hemolysin family protein [Bryobacteraceae bacterium]